jgi:hypothetical protein
MKRPDMFRQNSSNPRGIQYVRTIESFTFTNLCMRLLYVVFIIIAEENDWIILKSCPIGVFNE